MVFSQLKVVLYLETNDGLVGWCLQFFRAFPQAAELRNDTEQGSFSGTTTCTVEKVIW